MNRLMRLKIALILTSIFLSLGALAGPEKILSPLQSKYLKEIFVPVCGEAALQYVEPVYKLAVGKDDLLISTPGREFFIHLGESGTNTVDDLFVPSDIINKNTEEAQHALRRHEGVISNPHLHPLLRSDMTHLMPYQRTALTRMQAHFKQKKHGLVVLPTGTGKTVLAAHYAVSRVRDIQKNGKIPRILFVVDNLEVLDQAEKTFKRIWELAGKDLGELRTGKYTGREKFTDFFRSGIVNLEQVVHRDVGAVFASFQTLINPDHREALDLSRFSLIIFDEFHKGGASVYNEVVEAAKAQKDAKVLGLTATAFRSIDNVNVPGILGNNVIYSDYTAQRALHEGWVVPFIPTPITDDVDRAELIKAMERMNPDLDVKDQHRVFVQEWLEGVIKKYQEHAYDAERKQFRKGLIYVHNQKTARLLERMFELAKIEGINAKAIISDLSIGDQEHRTQQYREGKINVAITCNKFKEGVDVPDIEIIVHLKRVKSMVSYAHEVGRGMRVHTGKTDVKLLEFMFDYETMVRFLAFCRGQEFSGDDPKTLPEAKEMQNILTIMLGREVKFEEMTIQAFDRERGCLVSAQCLREQKLRELKAIWESGELKGIKSITGAAKILKVDISTLSGWLRDHELLKEIEFPDELLNEYRKNQEKHKRKMEITRQKRKKLLQLKKMYEEAQRTEDPAEQNKKMDRIKNTSNAAKILKVTPPTLRNWLRDQVLLAEIAFPEELVKIYQKNQEVAKRNKETTGQKREKLLQLKKMYEEAQSTEDPDEKHNKMNRIKSVHSAAKFFEVADDTLAKWLGDQVLLKEIKFPEELVKIYQKNQEKTKKGKETAGQKREKLLQLKNLYEEAQSTEDPKEKKKKMDLIRIVAWAAKTLEVRPFTLGRWLKEQAFLKEIKFPEGLLKTYQQNHKQAKEKIELAGQKREKLLQLKKLYEEAQSTEDPKEKKKKMDRIKNGARAAKSLEIGAATTLRAWLRDQVLLKEIKFPEGLLRMYRESREKYSAKKGSRKSNGRKPTPGPEAPSTEMVADVEAAAQALLKGMPAEGKPASGAAQVFKEVSRVLKEGEARLGDVPKKGKKGKGKKRRGK